MKDIAKALVDNNIPFIYMPWGLIAHITIIWDIDTNTKIIKNNDEYIIIKYFTKTEEVIKEQRISAENSAEYILKWI